MIINWKNFINKITFKSLQGDTGYASTNTTLPAKITMTNLPIQLMQLNLGIAYACAQKISSFVSSVPIHVYAEVPQGQADKLMIDSKKLSIKERKRVRTVKKGYLKQSMNTEVIELYDHPLIDLLNRPNGQMSWPDWISTIESYLSCIGNSYVLIERGKNNNIIALHPLLSEYVWVYTDGNGTILRYEYTPSSQEWRSKVYQPEEILHFRTPNAGNIVGGRGWMEAVQKEIRLLDEANNHQISLASNMGQPGTIITIHGKVGSKDDAEKVISDFKQKFSGLNRGKPFISFSQNADDMIDVKPYGFGIKDMVYSENAPYLRATICAASGVPEDLVHSGSSNRASSVTAMQSFLSFTICPRVNALIETLNHKIAGEYDENIFLGYDINEMIKADSATQATVIKTYIDSGVMSVNEARDILDLDPIEEINNSDTNKEIK